MSGTSLVILAMYTTVNVNNPFGRPLSPDGAENILTLMIIAAILTCVAIYTEGMRLPERTQPRRAAGLQRKPLTKREFGSPRDRRF